MQNTHTHRCVSQNLCSKVLSGRSSRTGLRAVCSVIIDSDLVVIIQAQLNFAALSQRSWEAREEWSGRRN